MFGEQTRQLNIAGLIILCLVLSFEQNATATIPTELKHSIAKVVPNKSSKKVPFSEGTQFRLLCSGVLSNHRCSSRNVSPCSRFPNAKAVGRRGRALFSLPYFLLLLHCFNPPFRPKVKAVILLGGFKDSTQFRPLSFSAPKPLFPIAGEPMLYHLLVACKQVSRV